MDFAWTARSEKDDQELGCMPKDEKKTMFTADGASSGIASFNDGPIYSLWHQFDGTLYGADEDKGEAEGVVHNFYMLPDALGAFRISLQSGYKLSDKCDHLI